MRGWGTLLLMAVVSVVAGCDQQPPQGKVTGTVKLNGELVNGGLIRFVAPEGAEQPVDAIITDGKYEVTLPPGKRNIELTWSKDSGAPPDTASQGTTPPPKELFPPKYNSQTTLKCDVKEGENPPLDFDLKAP